MAPRLITRKDLSDEFEERAMELGQTLVLLKQNTIELKRNQRELMMDLKHWKSKHDRGAMHFLFLRAVKRRRRELLYNNAELTARVALRLKPATLARDTSLLEDGGEAHHYGVIDDQALKEPLG